MDCRLAGRVPPCFGSCMPALPPLVRRRHIDLLLVAASLCPGGHPGHAGH